jgi:hypothetical protein
MHWREGVFVPDRPPDTGIVGSIKKRNCERVFLDILDRLLADQRYVSDNSRAGNYAPRVFAKCPDRENFTDADFRRAMERLFADRRIKMGKYVDAYRRKQPCIYPNTP